MTGWQRWLVAVLVSGAAGFTQSPTAPRANEDIEYKAVLELAQGDFATITPEEVIKTVGRVIASHQVPRGALSRLYAIRGEANYRLGKTKAAQADYEEAIRLAPNDPELILKRVSLFLENGEEGNALRELKVVIERWPSFGRAYESLGVVLLSNGSDHGRCLQALDRAIKLEPDNPDPYYYRALIRTAQRRLGPALDDLDRCITLGSRYRATLRSFYLTRSEHLLVLDRISGAARDVLIAQMLGERSERVLIGAWAVYFQAGKHLLARRLASEIRQFFPKSPWGHFAASYNALAAGDARTALQESKAAFELKPGNRILLRLAGNVALERGAYDEAVGVYDLIKKLDKSESYHAIAALGPKAYLLAACPDKRIRDGKQALALATQVSKMFEHKHPRYLMLQAIANAECGDFPRAVQLAKESLKLARPDFDFRPAYELLLQQFERRTPHRWERGCKAFDYFRPY